MYDEDGVRKEVYSSKLASPGPVHGDDSKEDTDINIHNGASTTGQCRGGTMATDYGWDASGDGSIIQIQGLIS